MFMYMHGVATHAPPVTYSQTRPLYSPSDMGGWVGRVGRGAWLSGWAAGGWVLGCPGRWAGVWLDGYIVAVCALQGEWVGVDW